MSTIVSTVFLLFGLYLIFTGSYFWALLSLSLAISLPITIFGILVILGIVVLAF